MMHAAQTERQQAAPIGGDAAVALKAAGRVMDAWGLSSSDAAALADLGGKTWSRIRTGQWGGTLTQDQLLRLSAIIGIYKALHLYFEGPLADLWVTRPNSGPLFAGLAPLERMKRGGLPAVLETRHYLDALRGGL